MHYQVVSYVKRKHYSDAEISEAFKIYCEYTGINPQLGWHFDFWINQLISGKEFHVVDSNSNEVLDQYLVSTKAFKWNDNTGEYYQVNLDGEEER